MTPRPRDSADTQECPVENATDKKMNACLLCKDTKMCGAWLQEHDAKIRKETINEMLQKSNLNLLKEHDAQVAAKERERVLEIIEGCISVEGFLCVDQDDPVVLVPDITRCIDALRQREQPK